MKLPTRKPDFYFQLVCNHKMEGWQQEDHYVLRYKIGDKYITIANKGRFEDKDKTLRREITYSVLKSSLDYINALQRNTEPRK